MQLDKTKLHLFLISGILLFLSSIILVNILRLPINWSIQREFIILPSFYFFLSAILLGPIWEELAFRFTLSKDWRINRVILLLYAVLLYVILKSIIIASLLVFATVLYNVLRKQNENKASVFLVFISALSWTMLHYSADAPSTTGQILNLTAILGLGLIFSFIRLRFSFLAVVILHVVWNGIAVFSSYIQAENRISIESGEVIIHLDKNSFLSRNDGSSTILPSSNHLEVKNATLTEITNQFLEKSPTIIYRQLPGFAKYSGTIKPKMLNPLAVGALFNFTVDSTITATQGYNILIEKGSNDSLLISDKIEYKPNFEIRRNSISAILTGLANDYNVPVELSGSPEVMNEIVTVQYPSKFESFEEAATYLSNLLGISLHISSGQLSLKTYYFY